LIVSVFRGLNDINSPSFARRVNILETVAKVRSCVVMLDLECDELILEMFHTFFDTASDEHPQNVFLAMRSVLTLVLEESEEIPPAILEVILKNLLKKVQCQPCNTCSCCTLPANLPVSLSVGLASVHVQCQTF
jgi:sister-chromatid-cohesion protein PDS5